MASSARWFFSLVLIAFLSTRKTLFSTCARLSLLPALALLLGALSPFAAAPAAADVLVSNFDVGGRDILGTRSISVATGFTTGSPTSGNYTFMLESIEVQFRLAPSHQAVPSSPLTGAQRDTIRAEVWTSAAGGGPGDKLGDLIVPSRVLADEVVNLAALRNFALSPDTTYYVVLYTVGDLSLHVRATARDNEDPDGRAGWSIGDSYWYTGTDTPSGSWTKNASPATSTLFLRVNGFSGSIAPPTGLTVHAPPEGGRLDLSWTAPGNTGGSAVTGYEVHYTRAAASAVGNDAAAGSDPATAWVAVSRNGTTRSQALTGLTNARGAPRAGARGDRRRQERLGARHGHPDGGRDPHGFAVGLAEPGAGGLSGDGDGDAVGGLGRRRDDPADADGRHGGVGGPRGAGEHHDQRRRDERHGHDHHGGGRRPRRRDVHGGAGHGQPALGSDGGHRALGAGDDLRCWRHATPHRR